MEQCNGRRPSITEVDQYITTANAGNTKRNVSYI